MDYKFKVGDRVRIVSTVFDTHKDSHIGRIGTVTKRDIVISKWYMLDNEHEYKEDWLEIAYVQNSKLARNLYKNQIKEIKDGKIWLK